MVREKTYEKRHRETVENENKKELEKMSGVVCKASHPVCAEETSENQQETKVPV